MKNDIIKSINEYTRRINNQLKENNTVSFYDYVEFNVKLIKLQELIEETKNEISSVYNEMEFSNSNINTLKLKIKYLNEKLLSYKAILFFCKKRIEYINSLNIMYEEKGDIKNEL